MSKCFDWGYCVNKKFGRTESIFGFVLKKKAEKRILLEGDDAVYHVVSRTAFGDFKFEDAHKHALRNILRRQAAFCGIEVLTYCLLDNHFHLLVRVPHLEKKLSDAEIIKRYETLYADRKLPLSAMPIEELKVLLKNGGPKAWLVRKQLTARMNNLPIFMKELKQRFSIWYNNHFNNKGTLWCEKFKSVLVENNSPVLKLVAAYIDLNPVRAGICDDSTHYPFCGFGEACLGNKDARSGILKLYDARNWTSIRKRYAYLLEKDQPLQPDKYLSPKDVNELTGRSGKTPIGMMLRERMTLFTCGGIIGSQDFVDWWHQSRKSWFKQKGKFSPKPLHPEFAPSLFTLYTHPRVRD